MKRRLAIVLSAAGALTMLGSVAARAAAPVPAACVVVTGPSGLNLQVGYAPNGPTDCRHLP